MKNFILSLAVLLLVSCAGTHKQASYVSSKSYIGMPLTEFKKLAGKKANLEVLKSRYTVYRINDYDVWTGALLDTKFYYFDSTAKLAKIDGGVISKKEDTN
ncbi:hypothetical protein [Pedobacter gandavensis]|uniref:hypothetical protein n=1 Tax=Pedobacter gandavensis TaxID=2679963 RepID=UPI0029313023|nr:hypothetical protein [Pedobacter gandavensis]